MKRLYIFVMALSLGLVVLAGCTAVNNTNSDVNGSISDNTSDNMINQNRTEISASFTAISVKNVPENATVVEYNDSSLQNSTFIRNLLETAYQAGNATRGVSNKQAYENISRVTEDLPIYSPGEGGVMVDGRGPYPPGSYIKYRDKAIFFTEGPSPL